MIFFSKVDVFYQQLQKSSIGKTAFTAALVGALFLTSACGANTAETTGNSATPSTTSTLAASPNETTVAATSVDDSSTLAGTVIDGIPTKKELGRNSKGEYIQNTIDPSHPAFVYNQAIVDQNAFKYTPEEITEVQAMIVKFVVEEVIGSSLNDNGTHADREAWWERHKDRFEPSNQDEFITSIRNQDMTRPVVFQAEHFRAGKYGLRYGKDVTHVLSRTITPTSVVGGELQGKQAMQINMNIEFDLAALVDGEVKKESTTGTLSHTALQDPATKRWLISGFTNTFDTIPLK